MPDNMNQEPVQLPPLVLPPPPQEEYEEVPVEETALPPPPTESSSSDTDDITGLSGDDKEVLFGTEGIADLDEEDDFSDLTDVTDADIMGDDESPKPKMVRRLRRTSRRYPSPPAMGGMQY